MQQIMNLSATALARAIRAKEISSTELVHACLKRIEEVNPKLNAVVQLAGDRALAEAAAADRALMRGEIRGPLHGIPVTIKDSLDTAGIVTTGGTKGRAGFVPEKDATVVQRLRAAGVILLGKTNTSELTLSYETDNLIYGRTNNPYDLSRSPGGSSGGAAAIVAAGGSVLDMGSDYGGSLRYPAHCCGIATIRPTSGRVPRTGHVLPFGGALDSLQQIGPMVRYVEDLILLLPLIAGPDYKDPAMVPMPLKDPEKVNPEGLRVAFHVHNGIASPVPAIEKAVRDAALFLERQGCILTEVRPDGIELSYDLMIRLLSADGGASIRRLLREAGTEEHGLPWLGLAEPVDAISRDSLMMEWSRFQSRMLHFFRDYDLILSPVNAQAALPHGSFGPELEAFSYTMTYNLTGWPAAVVRAGTSAEGLPAGVQIIAHPWREDVALAAAGLIEKALGGFQRPVI
jgi:amidase